MSVNLQYNYAQIDPTTFRCVGAFTSSYEIPLPDYILIPVHDPDYYNKYYNLNGDQMWYWDAEFTQLWEECPSHNV